MSKSGMLTAQFSTEAGLGAAAIRYLSDSDVSHVDLVVPRAVALARGYCVLGECGLLGARFSGGVRLRPEHYAQFTRTARLSVSVPDVDAAYDFAFAQVAKPYNSGAILDFFLHRRRGYTPDQKSWFCDELLYAICAAGGTQLLDTSNPLCLTPQEVMLSPKWIVR